MDIQNKDDFLSLIKQIEQSKDYKKPKAYGVAILDRGQLDKNKVLQALCLCEFRAKLWLFCDFNQSLDE